MLSENPVLLCGTSSMPWWRFAMAVLYLRITEHWTDKHDIHKDGSTSSLFNSLRLWRGLILDRNNLQMSRLHSSGSSKNTTLNLHVYNQFLSQIADYFILEYMPGWREVINLCQLGFRIWPVGRVSLGVFASLYGDSGCELENLKLIALGTMHLIWINALFFLSSNLDHTVRRPRRKHLRHNPGTWPEESTAKNTILSAIWSRQCREMKDYNFGTRNIVQALMRTTLPNLDYDHSIGEVYRDLTANIFRLTGSSELILAALRSSVPDAPSWSVDWSMRLPLRKYQSNFESDHGLFYDLTAKPIPKESVRFYPSSPDVLSIRAWKLGTVKAILEFRTIEESGWMNQRDHNIHNITALLQLANAQLDSEDWNYVMSTLSFPTQTFQFFRRNRHLQPEEILTILQSTGYLQPTSIWQRIGLRSPPRYEDLFDSYKDFCNKMATEHDRRLVVVSGARPSNSHEVASHWPSNLCMATCYPYPSLTTGNISSTPEGEQQMTRFQEVRVRPDDIVLQLCSMREKAVVRWEDNKLVFVDAIEAMGLPIRVSGWTKTYAISEMPLVDIDRHTDTPPLLTIHPRRKELSALSIPHPFTRPLFKAMVSQLNHSVQRS